MLIGHGQVVVVATDADVRHASFFVYEIGTSWLAAAHFVMVCLVVST